ncbi:hypothetical protein [Mycolicibacterium sphagni]|uniref:hypothetical protein n=1 Tax=Mycolicibacterium sphagni TaxID=1786 RepID=UPI0010541EDA|nr:hypothetical protein [Mycolicibacterium sphagni]
MPVVRWLQMSAAAAGIGLALVAAPGTAIADDGTGGSASAGSAGSGRGHANAVHSLQPKQSDRAVLSPTVRALEVSKARTAAVSALSAAQSGRQLSLPVARATAATITAPATLATSPIGVGLQLFLESAANFLAGFPANPITDALQGAVWAVRRTLFPATVGVVTAPIMVPLTLVNVCFGTVTDGSCSGTTVQRLGIWATLGSGNPIPQFFEFDTGAAGFHAAYASNDPTASPWWGTSGVTTGAPISKSFDSGLNYGGVEATTTVSFYSSAASTTALLTTGRVEVGQMNSITDGKDTLWNADGPVDGTAPVDGQFYGDFGAAPSYEANGISNVLNELTFAKGLTAGYRIDVDAGGQSWLQIGLTDADTEDPAGQYFAMVPDPSAPGGATNPHSGTRYFAPQLFLAAINITVGADTLISNSEVGITPDTGADTTLHNTDRSSQSDAITYAGITDGHVLDSGLNFSLTGTTTSGSSVSFLNLTTNDDKQHASNGVVGVQNGTSDKEVYYLNSGIALFVQNNVVYNMADGTLGLIP